MRRCVQYERIWHRCGMCRSRAQLTGTGPSWPTFLGQWTAARGPGVVARRSQTLRRRREGPFGPNCEQNHGPFDPIGTGRPCGDHVTAAGKGHIHSRTHGASRLVSDVSRYGGSRPCTRPET